MNRLPDTEKGSILVWTAVILAVLIAFAGLATDIPYLYVAKRQAQTAADAGAIAGAYGLLDDDAVVTKGVEAAKAIAGKTPIIGELLTDSEIDAFVCNSAEAIDGECKSNGGVTPYNQVTTITYRWTDLHGNHPMPLFVLPVLQIFNLGKASQTSSGYDAANVSATATARIFNTCSGECFKPWSIPDKWTDTNGNGQYDTGEPYDPATTGYQWPRDNGTLVTLKAASGNNLVPSFYYAVDFPPLNRGNPLSGANVYEENITTCGNGSFVAAGDQLQQEPGNMVGPTRQGVEALIALDPTAFWDTGCATPGGCVSSPFGATSPRLIRIAFFDPQSFVASGRKNITVTNVGGFFIQGMQGNDVVGYFTQVVASGGPVDPTCAGLQTVQLVK